MSDQATTTRRDADALDAEVAQLRNQARALDTARAEQTRASDSKWGGLRDDVSRDAEAARHASAGDGAGQAAARLGRGLPGERARARDDRGRGRGIGRSRTGFRAP